MHVIVWFNNIECQCYYAIRWDFWMEFLNVLRPPFCTLTFGLTGSMMMIDEDGVGLEKIQKSLDTSKGLHRNKTRSTGSVGKRLDSKLCLYRELQTWERAGSLLPVGSWEGVKSIHRVTTYHRTVSCPKTSPFYAGKRKDNWPPSRSHMVAFYDMQGEGIYYYTDPPRVPFY